MVKKLILSLLFLCSVVQAQTFNPAHGSIIDGKMTYNGRATWAKKVVTGVDSLYASGVTTARLFEASDSAYTSVYRNKGMLSVQAIVSGSATPNVILAVQAANSPGSAGSTIPDSLFQTVYWLVKGTGMAANFVETTIDSMTTHGKSTPIYVPLLGSYYWRILAYTTAIHSGRCDVMFDILMKEE